MKEVSGTKAIDQGLQPGSSHNTHNMPSSMQESRLVPQETLMGRSLNGRSDNKNLFHSLAAA